MCLTLSNAAAIHHHIPPGGTAVRGYTSTLWRQPAENVAETLTKGSRVIITGRLRQRSYETPEGEKRTVVEVDVDEIGPSLRYATARVTRAGKTTTTPAPTGGGGEHGGGDPWTGGAGGGDDQPPF